MPLYHDTQISTINLLDDSFRGAANNYQANIAVLEIDSKIAYSDDVKQVCVDWKNNFKFKPNDGTQGFVRIFLEKNIATKKLLELKLTVDCFILDSSLDHKSTISCR